MDSENKNTLGVLDWLVLGILLAFTSAGTFGLVQITAASDGLSLLVRQVAAVGFIDGIILYWHNRRTKYEDTEQRKYATYAMWAGVVTVLIFTVIYGAESVLLDGGLKLYKVTMFNMAVPLSELLGFTVTVILGLQAAGTLALILYIEQLNPRAKMLIEQRKAESEINKQQLTDYKTAQNTIAGVVGQAKAITALRSQLTALGYNERETEILVRAAMQKIADSKMIELPDTGSVPVSNGTGGGSLAESFFGTKARNKN